LAANYNGNVLTSRDLSETLEDVARPRKQEERDHVDDFLDGISAELPATIDLTVEGIVDRINGVNWRIRKMLDETLEQQGLTFGDWKVLSALRWRGKPHRRSAGELARIAELTSGTMTTRLDHLEGAGLVRRVRDPDDRRSVLVELTTQGRKKHDEAMGVQAEKEKLLADALSAREKEQLNVLLRRVMITLQERVPRKHD
jgi:DNA-binding MarR family transcriptional regulator